MKNQKLIQANGQILQRQLQKGSQPQWYVVYHLNDGLNCRYQQQQRINPDEVSKDIAFHKRILYKHIYCNRRWAKIPKRARSLWSIEYGRNKQRPHINMCVEALPSQFNSVQRLCDLFSITLPLRAKSILFESAHVQPVIHGTEMRLLRYVCKETDKGNPSIDYFSTDWIL